MQQPPQEPQQPYTQYPPYQQQTGPGIPPPPQYYPTGGLPPQYPPPPQPPSLWRRKFGCAPVWLIVLICGFLMVGGLISYAANDKSSVLTGAQVAATNSASFDATTIAQVTASVPVPTATLDASIPTSTPVPTSTPAPTQPPAKWRTTHSYSGSGDKQTGVITVPDDWKINWTCDARNNYGVQGVIYIEVYNSDGTASSAGDVSGNCATNKVTADSTEEHQGGDIYLKVLASVPWTIQIQEFK